MKHGIKLGWGILIVNFFIISLHSLSEKEKQMALGTMIKAMDQDAERIKQKIAEVEMQREKQTMNTNEAERLIDVLSTFERYIAKHESLLKDLQGKL